MNCDGTKAALSAATGAPLPPEAEAHLSSCSECRAWAMALDRLPERLSEWTAPEAPEDLEARVLARVRRLRRPARMLAMAAQVAVFILGALAGFAGAQWARGAPWMRGERSGETAVEPALDVTDDYVAAFGRHR
jgi:predicted anti-sigma-YlaC factor YlaD